MKNTVIVLLAFAVILLGVMLLSPSTSKETLTTPSASEGFTAVANRLEKGGDFYFYLGTKDAITSTTKKINELHNALSEIPDIKSEQKVKIDKAFKIASQLFHKSGIGDITGVGASSKKLNKAGTLFHNICFIHHPKKQNTGKLWSIFGKSPHKLTELSMLPSNTAYACYHDIDASMAWNGINKVVKNSEIPELQNGWNKFLTAAEKNGINITKIMNSVNGGGGMIITLNESAKISIPVKGKALKIPEPGIMIYFKVKDETIFNFIQSKVMAGPNKKRHMAKRADSKDRKALVFIMGIPFLSGPAVVVQTQGYLMIASNMKMVDSVLAAKSGKTPSLTSSEQFKKISAGIALKGNGFCYLSPKVQGVIKNVQKIMMEDEQTVSPKLIKIFQNMFYNKQNEYFVVNSIVEDGILYESNSTVNIANVLILQMTVLPVGIMSAMLLPALSKARESARRISCLNNEKHIGIALAMYANEHDGEYPKESGAKGLEVLRRAYNLPAKIFICPSTDHKAAEKNEPLTEETCDYIYIGGYNETSSADTVILQDKKGNHDNYTNTLFNDYHVKGCRQ